MTAPPMMGYRPQGSRNKAAKELERFNAQDANYYGGQARRADQLYGAALGDPTGTADLFGGYFRQAAEGYSRPALEDFRQNIGRVQANTAARFGGNVSGEEFRQVDRASDLFSRNLTDALARLAPQQVQAGADYTNQLGNRAGMLFGQSNTSRSMLGQGIQALPQGGGLFGSLLGTALGIGSLAMPGGGTIGGKLLGGLFR